MPQALPYGTTASAFGLRPQAEWATEVVLEIGEAFGFEAPHEFDEFDDFSDVEPALTAISRHDERAAVAAKRAAPGMPRIRKAREA